MNQLAENEINGRNLKILVRTARTLKGHDPMEVKHLIVVVGIRKPVADANDVSRARSTKVFPTLPKAEEVRQ